LISVHFTDATIGYAVGEPGVILKTNTGGVTAVDPPSRATPPMPSAAVLMQNYPNPFNPSTTIRYALPNRSHVTLTVYNTLGQHVAELVNGEIEAGNHEVRFNGSILPSGVYVYRLRAGDFVQTRKLLLVR
jgi:hypothetical protein